MKILRSNFRRWITGFFLGAACLMLFLGLTILLPHLQKTSFLVYWLICFLLTGLAAILALVDLVIIRRKSRDEQLDLIKNTLEKTEQEAKDLKQSDPEP